MRRIELRAWMPAVVTTILLVAVVATVQLLRWPASGDFRPFVMTIEEWNIARIGYADGTTVAGTETYRLEYRRYDDWTLTFVSDDAILREPGSGWACVNGTYETFDVKGNRTVRSTDPAYCNGVGRWIHHGYARYLPWQREIADGRVTYTSVGERIVFDLASGLPILYEAGPPGRPVGQRTIFRLERSAADTGHS